MVDLRHGQWGAHSGDSEAMLAGIKGLLSMGMEPADVAWAPEPARLFSIDTALVTLRRLWSSIEVGERGRLSDALIEARRLAIEGRLDELGYLQGKLECGLSETSQRSVWLTALNALLPCPFRAAEATVRAAIHLEPDDRAGVFAELLRERLRARLGEGMLMLEADLFAAV